MEGRMTDLLAEKTFKLPRPMYHFNIQKREVPKKNQYREDVMVMPLWSNRIFITWKKWSLLDSFRKHVMRESNRTALPNFIYLVLELRLWKRTLLRIMWQKSIFDNDIIANGCGQGWIACWESSIIESKNTEHYEHGLPIRWFEKVTGGLHLRQCKLSCKKWGK